MDIPSKNNKTSETAVIIGTGAVATIFIKQFLSIGITVLQQYGRNIPTELSIPFTTDFKTLNTTADFYIVAVNDDAIPEIVKQLPQLNGIIVHTAGSGEINVFAKNCKQYGVLYPLQSFSKKRDIDFKNTPFIIEGNSKQTETKLLKFAKIFSNNVHIMSYNDRLQVHLAAVFASNFSNHMNTIAQEILLEKNISFSLLKPLLQETFDKILTSNPKDAQTGPAKRNDRKILEKHSKMLTNNPNFQEIYNLVSKSIADLHKD